MVGETEVGVTEAEVTGAGTASPCGGVGGGIEKGEWTESTSSLTKVAGVAQGDAEVLSSSKRSSSITGSSMTAGGERKSEAMKYGINLISALECEHLILMAQ